MNKLFMRCIETVRNDPKKYIKERGALNIDRLMNRPPIKDLEEGNPVLFKDKWYSFGKLFLMGLDWDFVMLDCCVCSFIIQTTIYPPHTESLNVRLLLGVLVSYILDHILFYIRNTLSKRSLAKHTLVDDKFLFWMANNYLKPIKQSKIKRSST